MHLEAHLIEAYLRNIARILKPGGNVLITYSDKTKIGGQLNPTFGENTPARMREMVAEAGFRILEEELTILWNSAVIRFGI